MNILEAYNLKDHQDISKHPGSEVNRSPPVNKHKYYPVRSIESVQNTTQIDDTVAMLTYAKPNTPNLSLTHTDRVIKNE